MNGLYDGDFAGFKIASSEELDTALREAVPVQAIALRLSASGQSGRVSREKVYELGGYPDYRMLRGFTRPFRRLTVALQGEGAIPAGVMPIFVARYPDGVKASYFSAPPEVPQLLKDLSSAGPRHNDGVPSAG